MEASQPVTLGRLARASLQILLVAAAVAALGYVLIRLRLVVLPVVIALLVATVLFPSKEWLRKRGAPPALAAFVVMVAGIAVLTAIVAVLAPPVASDLGELGETARAGIEEVGTSLAEGPLGITDADVNQALDDLVTTVRENSGSITRGVLSGAVLVGELLAGLLLMLVFLFFVLKDGERMWSWVVDLFPQGGTRVDVRALGERAWGTLTGYIRGIAVVATVDSVLIGAGLAILGVPLVLPLAVLTFFAAFFPLVGAFTAGLIAALVALVSKGVVVALVVVAIITLVQQIEGDVIYPVVVGRAIRLHPVAILLAITAGAVVAGILGALLAPPLTAVAWTVVSYLRVKARRAPPEAPPVPA
jgi:putative heme transporter